LEETIENYIKLNLIMRDGNNIVLIDNVWSCIFYFK
jgi:hypothetical protein